MSGKDLYDFVVALPRGDGMIANRSCNKLNPGCLFSGGHVQVGIQAAADAKWLNDRNAGVNGTIAAVVENKGKYKTTRYGFEPSDPSEKHLYVFIVFRKNVTSGAKYVLEDIVTQGAAHSHNTVLTGNFILCNHDTWWERSAAAFQSCTGKMSRGTVGSSGIITFGLDLLSVPRAIVANTSAMVAYADDPPGWISCAAGCCTMGSANAN